MRGWRTAAGLLGAALALLLAAEAAQAQTSVTLVSNTGQSNDATSRFNINRAQAFTTGSNAAGYKLTSVTFPFLGDVDTSKTQIRIESSNASNQPGGSLGTLTITRDTTNNIATGTTTGIQLDPNTTYFVVLESTDTASHHTYRRTNSNSEDSGAAAGWSIGDGSLWDNDATLDWNNTSTTSWEIAIHGYATSAPPTVSSASYSPAHIMVNFNGPFTGCADLIAWSFRIDGGAQDWPLAVRCEGQSVRIIPDGVSDTPRIEAARRVTVSYHRGLARSAARSTPFCHPPRGCRPASSELKGTNGVDVASFTDFPVSGLKPRLVPPPAVNGNKVTLTFDEPLDPASRPLRPAFNVTVNGVRRSVAAAGVAVAGKTVTLTLASAVAAGETVQVRYTNLSNNRNSNQTLKGANRLMVDSFEYQMADNPQVIWSATLTVAEVMAGGQTYHGCFAGIEGKECGDLLTQSSFVSGGTSYEIRGFSRNYSQRALQFSLDRAIPQDWTWHVDGQRFPVANRFVFPGSGDKNANFQNVHFDWADGQQVSVCLTTGSSATGSANPCPASSGGSDDTGGTGGSGGEPASVTGVEVVSNAGADKTYGLGDTIQVRVTFDGTVDVTGTPRLKIDMDPADWGEKWAAYASGSGTSRLTFAHTVVEPNYSSRGIAVLENTLALNGGTIRAGGADATLAHDGRPHDANHKVNWQVASDTEGGSGGGPVGTSEPNGGSAPSVASVNSGPPTVTGVQVVSDPGDDDTYLLGDTIRIRATFSETVNATGSPRLSIDMSPEAWGTKQAAYESGSGTGSLDFTWTVVEPNYAPQGIAVLANSLALNGGTIRSAATNANAALAHTKRDHDTGHKVDWRPEVSVADASANEGTDANAAFTVSLSRAFTTAGHRVTVDYTTADGTATAGEDYTATSGTLTFAAGEKTKTVNVPILDDAVDEGSETFTLRLSNARGGRIGDGEATGTISNDDALPKAWTARFGRSVAVHVVDAVEMRLEGPTESWAQLGGHRLGGGEDVQETAQRLAPEHSLWQEADAADTLGQDPGSSPGQAMTVQQLLLGSAFHLVSNAEDEGGGPRLSAWGRVATSGFDGWEDELSLDGTVTTATLGVDGAWERWLTGLLLAYSEGEGSFSHLDLSGGDVSSSLTSVHPYVAYTLSDRVRLWGMVGYGSGAFRLEPEDRGAMDTDLTMSMGALGVRGSLLEPAQQGGFRLALRSDVLWMVMDSAAADNLAATEAEASRLRLVLEGSRPVALAGGGSFTPSLEVGLRHDGGDADTGTGVEVGGRLRYASSWGLSLEASVRGLLAHEAQDYTEWGASGALRFDPGRQGRGLTASISPTWGHAASGVSRLWGQQGTAGLVPADALAPTAAGRLDAELGYGLATFQGRGLLTPYARVALTEGPDQAWHLGTRLALAESLNFSLEAGRRAREGEVVAHELALRANLGF